MKTCHQRLNASWTKKIRSGVWTTLHGAGANRTLGTPSGRQFVSGSSRQCNPAARSSKIALADGWNGTGSFRSFVRSLKYPIGGFQTPEKSGLPSGKRGAGADRSGLPSVVRGIALAGTLLHHGWANSGCDSRDKTSGLAATISNLLAVTGICMEPPDFRRLYILHNKTLGESCAFLWL